MKKILCFIIFCQSVCVNAQSTDTILTLQEYLGYVKSYHPIVKQAQLISSEGEIKRLKARGAFDPKLEVDYNRKKFKGTEYYDKLNTAFKIPTWYGVELKASYENSDGTYLNPEYNTPEDGLYSAGVSLSLAKELLINERMATLKQAKLYIKQAEAKQKLLVNDILYEAISVYFDWLKNYEAQLVYKDYVANAEVRLGNVKTSFFAGDKPAVDTLEARINLNSRQLDLEKARISYVKASYKLSNYLWLDDNLPLELDAKMAPDTETILRIDTILNSSILNSDDLRIEDHPKLQELELKKSILEVDKRLKTNNLLPTVNLQYNFISSEYKAINTFSTANYKSGLQVVLPLFLRKERADLKLAKLKLQDLEFDISTTKVQLKNKIQSALEEIDSYSTQYQLLIELVGNYKQLVTSEERKFSLGESSLFLVNYRGVKLIESELKRIDAEYQVFMSKSSLLKTLNEL
ncbi:TolC family protein [Lacinutrix undariae]